MKINRPQKPHAAASTKAKPPDAQPAPPASRGWSAKGAARPVRAAAALRPVDTHGGSTLAGTTALKPQQLQALLDGVSPMAERARLAKANLEATPEYAAASPEQKQQLLSQRLSSDLVVPGLVSADVAQLATAAARYAVTGPTLEANHEFPGKKTDADRYEVLIDGRSIPVYVPHDGAFDPPFHHRVEDAAKTLASIPAESRALVTQVSLDPVANPLDDFWSKTYGREMTSYMTCGADGKVDIYPFKTQGGTEYMAASLIHETGHAWSGAKFGGDLDGPAWAPWRDAVAKDGILPSQYASSSAAEDVAESTALYLSARDTPAFAEYRALYPNRFALLDQQFGVRP